MTAVAEAPKNRYAAAPRNSDYTIDQDWGSYTAEESPDLRRSRPSVGSGPRSRHPCRRDGTEADLILSAA